MKNAFFKKVRSVAGAVFASLKEQRVIFAVSLISCIFICLNIYDLDNNFAKGWTDLFSELGIAALMSCIFTIPAAYLLQKSKPLKKYLIQTAVALAGGTLGFFAQRGFGNQVYGNLYFWGIFFAAVLITVYVFIPKTDGESTNQTVSNTYFAGLIKHFLFSGLMAGILFGGLALLIAAFQNLIFEGDDWAQIYECTAVFCFFVFAVNVFVYYLFYRRQEESSGKAFKIIFLYILLPVFFTLIALLYAYLFKALILWKLPNGQINWFVSFASCIYIVFYFILREYQNLGAVRVFYKFGAFAFIPLICVQIPAYFIRLNAYGFTGWRFSSLMFIIFSVITIALTFIKKGRFTKYSILLLAAIILFASVTPMNLINSAHKSQFKRMMAVLNKYGMYDSQNECLADFNKDEINKTISEQDREQLFSSFRYLRNTSELPLPEWAQESDNDDFDYQKSFAEWLFGIDENPQEDKIVSKYHNVKAKDAINIEDFAQMQEIENGLSSWGSKNGKYQDYATKIKRITLEFDGEVFDITDFIMNNTKDDGYLWYNLDEEKVLCLTNYSYNWNKDLELFREYNFSGYLFWKKLNP